jgi:hypothetical protein
MNSDRYPDHTGGSLRLPGDVRSVLLGAVILNGIIGALFLLGPELHWTPWPSPVSPVLTRFIGAILLGNAAGAAIAARQGTWEGARVLFAVAAVYGLLTLIFVPWAILTAAVDQVLWAYVAVDAVFELAVIVIIVRMESAWRSGRSAAP